MRPSANGREEFVLGFLTLCDAYPSPCGDFPDAMYRMHIPVQSAKPLAVVVTTTEPTRYMEGAKRHGRSVHPFIEP